MSAKKTVETSQDAKDFKSDFGATDLEVIEEANIATDKEHNLTLARGLKAYPKAIAWSILLSSAVVMEGYDTLLIGSFFAFPSFLNTFSNTQTSDGTLEITAPWQSAIGNGAYIGEVLGLHATGWICDLYGYRFTMTLATSLMIGFIFISFFSTTLGGQLAGQILCGIPWGA